MSHHVFCEEKESMLEGFTEEAKGGNYISLESLSTQKTFPSDKRDTPRM